MFTTFALCQASFASGRQSRLVRDAWFDRATNPSRIEHCLGFEYSDMSVANAYGISSIEPFGFSGDYRTKYVTTVGDGYVSAVRNWNSAAKTSTAEILIAIADDLIPEQGWDDTLTEVVTNLTALEALLVVSDQRCLRYKTDPLDSLLPRHPIMTRALYRRLGFLFPPEYRGYGADNMLLKIAISEGFLIDARETRFHHSVGSVFDSSERVTCGCDSVNVSQQRNLSQKAIHADVEISHSSKVDGIKGIWAIIVRLACTPNHSQLLLKSITFGSKNNPIWVLFKFSLRFLLKSC